MAENWSRFLVYRIDSPSTFKRPTPNRPPTGRTVKCLLTKQKLLAGNSATQVFTSHQLNSPLASVEAQPSPGDKPDAIVVKVIKIASLLKLPHCPESPPGIQGLTARVPSPLPFTAYKCVTASLNRRGATAGLPPCAHAIPCSYTIPLRFNAVFRVRMLDFRLIRLQHWPTALTCPTARRRRAFYYLDL